MDQNNFHPTQYSSIFYLRKGLSDKNTLQIIHPDAIWTASFFWNEPLVKTRIEITENLKKFILPKDLVDFWKEVSDGVSLYFDQKFGQWGYNIYSSSEISSQQARWKELFGDTWKHQFTVIGEIIDEVHPIIAIFNETSHKKG